MQHAVLSLTKGPCGHIIAYNRVALLECNYCVDE